MNLRFPICSMVERVTPCAPLSTLADGAHGVMRSTCAALVIALLLINSVAHALPAQKPVDAIPPLAPPLPEIQSTFWERHPVLQFALPSLAAGLALGIWQLWTKRKKTPPRLIDPATQARAALTALQACPEDAVTLGNAAQTLRRYLIAAFWLPAGETTTAEFCRTLQSNPHVGAELSRAGGEFLMRCDERKFSPAPSPAAIGAVQRALELIDMAEARRAQVPVAPLSSKPA
jgi:hypothetical protein